MTERVEPTPKEALGLRYGQIVSVRFDSELYEHMKRMAVQNRQRISEYVRDAVIAHSQYRRQ